jgi:hypothetical protein
MALLSQYIASRLILDPKLEEACTGVDIETVGKTLETIIGGKLRQPIVKLEN